MKSDDKMKKSSTKHAPNGSTPPMMMLSGRDMYHGWSGIVRGMLLIFTGKSMLSLRKPMYAPRNTRGTLMPNHSASSATSERSGTAAVEPEEARMMSNMRKPPKHMP